MRLSPSAGRSIKFPLFPPNLYQVAEKELFTEILDRLRRGRREGAPEVIRERLAFHVLQGRR